MTVSVIIPAHNESQAIGGVIETIRDIYPDFEIIVVDDGSEDNTGSVAANAGAKVVTHPYNIGNGAAVKSGIRNACGDILVFMDGDGQHDPKLINELLKYFPAFDMVVGARQRGHHASIFRESANLFYNYLASYVAKFSIKDLTSGFRAVKREKALDFLYLLPNTYSYPSTLTLSVLRSGGSVKYIPIRANKRKTGKSGIRMFKDGVRFLMIIIKICTLYSPLRVFLPISFLTFLLGWIRYIHSFITQGRFTNMSALLFTTSVLIFMMGLVSEQICQMRYEKSEQRIVECRVDDPISEKKKNE